MKTKKVNGVDTKVKRKSKSQRTYIRRMKQAERKDAMPIIIKKATVTDDHQ